VGGAEKTLFRLATLIDPGRFSVAGVVSLKPGGDYLSKLSALGAKTASLDLRGRPGLRHASRLSELIERERPDIVHALMYQAIQLCRLAKRRLRGRAAFRLVTSPRVSYRTRSAFTLLVDRALKGGDDLLIAESGATREHLIHQLGYATDRVKVVYNGVDAAPAGLQREQKRLELQLGPEELLLGTVGRLDDQKGHAVLLEAVARLKDSIALRLVILGEGPLRPALEGQIRRLRLERSVRLLGERADVASWLSALDLFVLPSLWEGLPNSLLEAMAIGLPCLATSVDGVPEVILPGQNGLLVPAGDSAALAQAITALAKDPAARSRLGQAAAKTARERFSLSRMIAEYEATYSEVMSRPTR
jgi:glycosyltransferase involved in cell wall biosynthesis